jgi:hypothetical protein
VTLAVVTTPIPALQVAPSYLEGAREVVASPGAGAVPKHLLLSVFLV